jgi:hypothetical protein
VKKQDFIKAVRQGGAKFRADNIVITMDAGQLQGKGLLEVADGCFRLHVTLDDGSKIPEVTNGIKVQREFWTVRGKIEDEIGFSLRSLPNNVSRNYTFGQADKFSVDFTAGHIELAAIGFDNLTSKQVFELQQQAAGQPIPASVEAPPQNTMVVFHAVLPNFKLIERNAGTETKRKNDFLGESSRSTLDTFHSQLATWEYGLVEQDGDLHVHLLSKPEHQSQGEEHDWRLFQAFLNALAFTHAQHAWPFSVEHRRDGKLTTDRVHLHEDVADSPHAPFSEALAFNNLTKNLKWSFGVALEHAYTFFSGDALMAREVETVLYIFREATGRGIPKRIALLSLCSLFESLVRAVYEEQVAPKNADAIAEFQRVKDEVCAELLKKGQPAHQRLVSILKPAEPVNNRMRYEAVIEHLGLKPQAYWQELYGLWSKFRNPMSHRMAKEDKSEDSIKDELIAESRIAGAINCMILKLMNYSGYVRISAYEGDSGKYAQI